MLLARWPVGLLDWIGLDLMVVASSATAKRYYVGVRLWLDRTLPLNNIVNLPSLWNCNVTGLGLGVSNRSGV